MKAHITAQLDTVLKEYAPITPGTTADALRELWLQFEPKSVAGIKAEQRKKQKTVGIPVKVLRTIGGEVGKTARKRVEDFISLTRLLWDNYGREGRVVTVCVLGKMTLADPERMLPLLMDLCRTCITWEDADQMAMRAVEPIVRKKPEMWLLSMASWLEDENKWVQRAGVTVVGRLPMKHAAYTERCLAMTERLLYAEDTDVRKAVSFAIRVCARGELAPVRDFLTRHVPPENPAATWVLCDAIRNMTTRFLPEFSSLLPLYEAWANVPSLPSRDRRSVESAVRKLQKAQT